ncbi:hypothetical protein SO802_004699 [Lithocarpus litseifolius]|uniref:Uncharacterized protein n=1 Tax=Lithocarpus litseifolius TaxID=425828 RepID=A0AAW2E7L3_9ROSI
MLLMSCPRFLNVVSIFGWLTNMAFSVSLTELQCVSAHCLVHNGYKVCAYLAKLQLKIYILLECGLKCQAWDLNGLGGLASFQCNQISGLDIVLFQSQFVKQRDFDITSP